LDHLLSAAPRGWTVAGAREPAYDGRLAAVWAAEVVPDFDI
jgi:hypothetical protein